MTQNARLCLRLATLVGAVGLAAIATAPDVSNAVPNDSPTIGSCQVFPANNIWNTRIDSLPVHARSDAWIASIGESTGLTADFGSGLYEGSLIGIPYLTVPGSQPEVSVSFDYEEESDPGPYQIPDDAPVEGGGDRHVLIVNRDTCVLAEVFEASMRSPSFWTGGSGAVFDLNSNVLRPDGWTSADAAGLPIFPGLVRYDEIETGEIAHALRFTVARSQKAYLWPARHFASDNTNPNLPPMGARARLKAHVDISSYSPEVRIILLALQRYGMFMADNGSNWFVSGAPDARWNNNNLREIRNVIGSNLEFVDASSLMVHPDSGEAGAGAVPLDR